MTDSYYEKLVKIFEKEDDGRNKVIYPETLDVLDSKERAMLKDDEFALPKKRKYPIPDIEHAKLALEYVKKIDKLSDDRQAVESVVYNRFPELKPNHS